MLYERWREIARRCQDEIALRLDINVATVKLHLRSLSKKLAVRNRTQLVLKAIELGLG